MVGVMVRVRVSVGVKLRVKLTSPHDPLVDLSNADSGRYK